MSNGNANVQDDSLLVRLYGSRDNLTRRLVLYERLDIKPTRETENEGKGRHRVLSWHSIGTIRAKVLLMALVGADTYSRYVSWLDSKSVEMFQVVFVQFKNYAPIISSSRCRQVQSEMP